MTKPELLKLMRLLSGVESLLLYSGRQHLNERHSLPDYLLEELGDCAEMLECEILKPEPTMNAIELANKYYTTGVMSAVEAAAMLRRQHEAIVKLREALQKIMETYPMDYEYQREPEQALKDTEDLK